MMHANRILTVSRISIILCAIAGCARPAPRYDPQVLKDPLGALQAGNERFAAGNTLHPNQDAAHRASMTKYGPKPFATILACSDPSVPVELLFDRGIGDIYAVRVEGNVCGAHELASVEYSIDRLKIPLIVVLGHSGCGAVAGATYGSRAFGLILDLMDQIKPAVEKVRAEHPELRGQALLAETTRANVRLAMQTILTKSDICRNYVAEGNVQLVGAVYDIATGKIEWLGPHPDQAELLKR